MSQATMSTAEPVPEIEREVDSLYEVIDGRRVEKPPMSTLQALIAAALDQLIGGFVRANRLGRVAPEMLFRINLEGHPQRRPDVAFVSYARWPRDRKFDKRNGWDVVPELAIEVISQSNTADEVVEKIGEYFQAGVLRVWVVYTSVQKVYVYESPEKVTIRNIGDDLDGGDILPGFTLHLAELFEDAEEA